MCFSEPAINIGIKVSVLFANRNVSPVTSLSVPCLFFRVISASERPQLPLYSTLQLKSSCRNWPWLKSLVSFNKRSGLKGLNNLVSDGL